MGMENVFRLAHVNVFRAADVILLENGEIGFVWLSRNRSIANCADRVECSIGIMPMGKNPSFYVRMGTQESPDVGKVGQAYTVSRETHLNSSTLPGYTVESNFLTGWSAAKSRECL